MDISQARKALQPLLDRYNQNKDNSTFTGNEKQVCQSLIVPFVRQVLGWDTEDPTEFHAEESLSGRRIDYVVYNKGISQFVIETKALSKNIFDDGAAYKQALDYGYSKDKEFAILTNFRQVVLLGSKIQYRVPEGAEIARLDLLTASDEVLELLLSFGKEYWLSSGKENRLYKKLLHHKPQIPVDERLLEDMKHWREHLLRNLKKNHQKWHFDEGREFMHIEEEVQKFIDRLIFICFCEDKELNEPQLKFLMDEKKSDRFFSKPGWLLGKIQEVVRHYAERYDSDLFDKSLADEFKIDDDRLIELLRDLREPPGRPAYDFDSIEADILGKVYENFIGHIQGGKKRFKEHEDKGKRKKTGIYYTPKFIVDYIVNNTVREYIKEKSFEEILKVRILDPACGSGSFLIKAFDVLIEESERALKRPPTYAEKKKLMFNCIFGVDVDERAVAIAKLNLSLRMAERGNLLPTLRENIRLGNSLIDDSKIAGYKAFVWNEEFKDVMSKGGFDIVIGNPPYVRIQTLNKKEAESFKTTYKAASKGNYDIYVLFVERGLHVLNPNGRLGFILPHKFFNAKYGVGLRNLIAKGKHLSDIVHFGDQQVFEGATTYTCLLFLNRAGTKSVNYTRITSIEDWLINGICEKGTLLAEEVGVGEWTFVIGAQKAIFEKLKAFKIRLGDVSTRICQGPITSADPIFLFEKVRNKTSRTIEVFSNELGDWIKIETESLKPVVRAGLIGRYAATSSAYVLFPYAVKDGTAALLSKEELQTKCPLAWKYLALNKKKLENREGGAFKDEQWYRFGRTQNLGYWEQPKILVPYMISTLSAYFDQEEHFYFINVTTGGYGVTLKESVMEYPYVCGLLNSKLLDFFLKNISTNFQGGYFAANKHYIEQLPLVSPDSSNQLEVARVIRLVERMLILNKQLNTPEGQASGHKEKLQHEIERTDHEIDELVYKLYGITDEEKKIIEESLQ